MRFFIVFCGLAVMFGSSVGTSSAEPVQNIRGVITEVGDGFIWLVAEKRSEPQRFILPWKARFIPPKLPIKGDHVSILYKIKEDGPVIYGLEYLKIPPE
ncbi:MAG: hypothetical protein WCG29_13170 [Desulfomonile sp.]|jgi:hypothetical protein|nr:hypothetical protein [Deltaproteobacteria bacterium]